MKKGGIDMADLNKLQQSYIPMTEASFMVLAALAMRIMDTELCRRRPVLPMGG